MQECTEERYDEMLEMLPPAMWLALYPATSDSEKVSFNQINRKPGHRIKYAKVDADSRRGKIDSRRSSFGLFPATPDETRPHSSRPISSLGPPNPGMFADSASRKRGLRL
jgi:hypothetical protein